MRQRNPRQRTRRRRRRHAGDDFVANARRFKRRDFLRRAAKDRGVAPLEPDDGPPRAGRDDHVVVNFFLAEDPPDAVPAKTDQLRRRRGELQHPWIDEVVVQHQVGHGQPFPPAQREEPRIAGPRTNQKHLWGSEHNM